MRFDLHLRAAIKDQIAQLADVMAEWEAQPRLEDDEITQAALVTEA